jgi:hypothetical protein
MPDLLAEEPSPVALSGFARAGWKRARAPLNSLAAHCLPIPGCEPSLSDLDFGDICGLDPMRADSGGARTIISNCPRGTP